MRIFSIGQDDRYVLIAAINTIGANTLQTVMATSEIFFDAMIWVASGPAPRLCSFSVSDNPVQPEVVEL